MYLFKKQLPVVFAPTRNMKPDAARNPGATKIPLSLQPFGLDGLYLIWFFVYLSHKYNVMTIYIFTESLKVTLQFFLLYQKKLHGR